MLHYDFAALIIAATLLLLAEVLIDTYLSDNIRSILQNNLRK